MVESKRPFGNSPHADDSISELPLHRRQIQLLQLMQSPSADHSDCLHTLVTTLPAIDESLNRGSKVGCFGFPLTITLAGHGDGPSAALGPWPWNFFVTPGTLVAATLADHHLSQPLFPLPGRGYCLGFPFEDCARWDCTSRLG